MHLFSIISTPPLTDCHCHCDTRSVMATSYFLSLNLVLIYSLYVGVRAPFVQSSFDMQAPRQSHVFISFFFLFIWRCRFFRVFFLYHYYYFCCFLSKLGIDLFVVRRGSSALRSIVLRYAGAPTVTRVYFFFLLVYLEMSLFPSIFFVSLLLFLLFSLINSIESTSYVLSFRMVFSTL